MIEDFKEWLRSLFHICSFDKTLLHTKKPAVLSGNWKYTVQKQCTCGKTTTILGYEDEL